MARRKQKEDHPKMSIERTEFLVTEDRKDAIIHLEYKKTVNDYTSNGMVDYALASLWIDQEESKAIRAHIRYGRSRLQKDFFDDVLLRRRLTCTGKFGLQASPTSAQLVMIYGLDGEELYTKYDQDEQQNKTYYTTKAQAFRSIFTKLKQHRSIGGLNLASMSNLSDDILVGLGFQRIDDLLGRGAPMWKGTANILEGYGGYSYTQRQEQNQVIQSLLTSVDAQLRLVS